MRTKHLLLLLFLIAFGTSAVAQEQDLSPWTDNPHGNEWIDYSKKYVRVGITQDGIYKIPLATLKARLGEFGDDLNETNVQAWFRGKQIALLIQNGDVIFYGRKNDGVSDGLMFRNLNGDQRTPGERLNIYDSFYSEQGAHFFTKAKLSELANLKRISSVNAQVSDGVTTETYHTETVIKTNGDFNVGGSYPDRRYPRSFAGVTDLAVKALNNSFFTSANAFIKLLQTNAVWDETLDLPGFVNDAGLQSKIEFAIHGDGSGSRNVEAYASSNEANLNDVAVRVSSSTLSSYSGKRENASLITGTNISEAGKLYLRFKSNSAPNISLDGRNRYGVSYYRIDYPQSLSFSGQNEKKYYFGIGVSGKRNISIPGVPGDIRAFNITNEDSPVVLQGAISSGTLNVGVDREANNPLILRLVSTSNITQVPDGSIHDVKFDLLYSSKTKNAIDAVKPEPSDYDYLVITHISTGDKNVAEGAVAYADYRASEDGGGYNTLVISTRTIYDQFNYGEPSPVAIGRFVNYMIQSGVRSKHNVLLVGHGVGQPDNIFKELPSDIPTYGNPGSDVLLISGLSNAPDYNLDIPAIPIGRIPAFTNDQVENYRNKVKEYERQTREESTSNLAWRRKVLNIIGYKVKDETIPNTTSGVPTYKEYVNDANSKMNNTYGPWSVSEVSNEALVPASGNTPRTNAPIENQIDAGVGVIGYYGHGDHEGTTYNIGSPKNRFNNSTKYPFVYITGCGVGDAFYSHSTQYVASDWIVVPNKGAIAFLANTYLAYTNTAAKYMKLLYGEIFDKSDARRKTIGNIQKDMAKLFIGENDNAKVAAATATEKANIHQTALFGDPAIRILLESNVALPVTYKKFDAYRGENNVVNLIWETSAEINNDFFIIERSADGKSFHELGQVNAKRDESAIKSYIFTDTSPLSGKNYYRLKQWDYASNSLERQYTYSNIVFVDIKNGLYTNIYPNPATEKITISSHNFGVDSKWQIVDGLGHRIISGKGQNIDLKKLPAGNYILIIHNSAGEKESHQFIKH